MDAKCLNNYQKNCMIETLILALAVKVCSNFFSINNFPHCLYN